MPTTLRTPCTNMAESCQQHISPDGEKWILTATILGSTMVFIDGTIVNVALPALQTALHTNVSQMQWVVEAYSLTLAPLLLIGGALGDIYGRRIIFLIGTILFTLASVSCGFATTITELIMGRAIQGIGAALLVPGSLALISASFPEKRRGQAIGTWAGATAITSAAGPIVGGWIVQHYTWRLIFFLNVPLALIVIFITIARVGESKNRGETQKLDIAGAIFATLGLAGIIYGLIEWAHGGKVVLFAEVAGITALIAFFVVETRVAYPMVPMSLFKSRNFSGANLLTLLLYFSLYGVLFFLPLDLIQVQGYTPTQAGAALLPVILLIFLLSRWSGGLIDKFGAKLPLIIGPAVASLGFALFLFAGINHLYWTSFFIPTTILGLGMAISVAPLTTVVMNSISQEHAGAASGINNSIAEISGLLAVAVLGVVMTLVFNHELAANLQASNLPAATQQGILAQRSLLAGIKTTDAITRQLVQQSFIAGYDVVIAIAVILCLGSAITAAIFIQGKNKPIKNQ